MKSHYVMQDVFAGHDVRIGSNGYSNQTGKSNVSFINSTHLPESRILEKT